MTAAQQQHWAGMYQEDIQSLPPPFQHLLEAYTHLQPDEMLAHVKKVRDQSYAQCPYPCLGMFRFTILVLSSLPVYPVVLEKLRPGKDGQGGGRYLDLGCCFGQDLRQLVVDGVPSENTHMADIDGALMEYSYELFRDRDTLQTTKHVANILEPDDPTWVKLRADGVTFDVIHASAFFHLFPFDQQEVAATVVAGLTNGPGSIIAGRQAAKEGEADVSETCARNSPDSWRDMWTRVGEKTGTKWSVEVTLDTVGMKAVDGDDRRMLFTVTRLE